MLRGKQLDEVIEQELQMMLIEGFEKSPISHKLLHKRLTAKGYISGGLSTLSSSDRKKLISLYLSEQISPLNLKIKEKQLFVNKKTRLALTNTNKNLRTQIEELESQLAQNTESLINIIEEVKLKTNLKVDHLLASHLLKKYLSSN
ncbi:hypothetical protein NYW84_08770 [Acinetobacter junii]|jgi:hypothetical protein|uniref:hypothetical protein n=1 Tax=Acinetobacter TaxID=469 RepID=UPI0009504A82|nr:MULTISPECIES: hypothetical protein [Acinetobacter]APU48741.1 hypothetical protein BVL33_09630 [Acinetobacter junii]MCR4532783.1 hypothetical protein [Acinetobacter venetianus]MCU4408595.1 hypothetical protein [Acinetobacter junii]MDH1713990.1 hypothetical protein [Acinetobacter johnsonii]MDU2409373.1 hypothetical protein [Acinetobacter junii]